MRTIPKTFPKKHRRFVVLYLGLMAMTSFLLGGLLWRQIFQHTFFEAQKWRQNTRRVILPAARGEICDRHGHLLVCNRPTYALQVCLTGLRHEFRHEFVRRLNEAHRQEQPYDYLELQRAARLHVVQSHMDHINALIGRQEHISSGTLERHFLQKRLLPLLLFPNLSEREYALLAERLPPNFPLQPYVDATRYYPYGTFACHVLGYVAPTQDLDSEGILDDTLLTFKPFGKQGKTGVELAQQTRLRGENGGEIWSVDPAGFQRELLERQEPVPGQDLHLSLDRDLQLVAEEALEGRCGSAVMLEIATGEVLAMASRPHYDLNRLTPRIHPEIFQEINAQGGWFNRALQGLFPPSSTFKILVSIALLRGHYVDWSAEVNCNGYSQIGNRRFHCDSHHQHGPVGLFEAITRSCNVFFFERTRAAGIYPIAAEARRFGLDHPTGIDLPYETRRMVIPTPEWKRQNGFGSWLGGDTANTTIGQGYTLVTPLQMACFMASVARGRTRTHPSILHDPAQHRQSVDREAEDIGLSYKDHTRLLEALESVVLSGTGKRAASETFRIAGKTGTAQVRLHGRKRNVAWFVGFAPIEAPEVAVAIEVQEQAEDDHFYGGKETAPIARAMMEAYFLGQEGQDPKVQ
jgi:penicillin-binding protein 2